MAARQTEDDKRTYLAVARAIWRMDKANPDIAREMSERIWADAKLDYVKRARKLMKAFDRDGITILIPESSLSEGE